MDDDINANVKARAALVNWENQLKKNIYTEDHDFQHTIQFWCKDNACKDTYTKLEKFGLQVAEELEPLVAENNLQANLPHIEAYNGIGENIEEIIHHPTYALAGNIIYGTGLLKNIAVPGGLFSALSLFFLSSQAGEAGHNCPIACSAGILRVFQNIADFPDKHFFVQKLIEPSYQNNFTGAQFLTEIQGGSDVGENCVEAKYEDEQWRIYGEKWFCSNADADLIFLTARYDETQPGTKGLALFLIPSQWQGKRNLYYYQRLKDKLGTRTMATAEILFKGAYAIPMGELTNSFKLVMENVLHISRLFNSICVLGMAKRAYTIARSYAQHRIAFEQPIINYPLVQENLARIKCENSAMIAAMFQIIHLQDQFDLTNHDNKSSTQQLLLRLLVNVLKFLTAKYSVEHVHHSLDVLAGNGTIETFSAIPRLLRDCIVCENWEGTHNTLMMQVFKDIHKYDIDKIYLSYMENELDELTDNIFVEHLKVEFNKLRIEIETFRLQDNKIQRLAIKEIVSKMAKLFCAFALLIEALDQKRNQSIATKLAQWQLYFTYHFHSLIPQYTQKYLNLINDIVLHD